MQDYTYRRIATLTAKPQPPITDTINPPPTDH